jgi:cell division protein FtsB
MLLLRPRGRRRPGRRRRLARLLAIGVIALLALLYYRPVRTYIDTHRTLSARRAEVRALAERNRRLTQRLQETRSGATLVIGARRLGLVKPGEHLFIVRGISQWRRAHARHR